MNIGTQVILAVSIVAGAIGDRATLRARDRREPVAPAPCSTDSGYRRLAFWVGDWTVFDSTGKRYASQRVRDAVDGCALTVEWNGGGNNQGLSLFGFDARSTTWRQMYVSNQIPQPTGVILRQSDPEYSGPGVRFISIVTPPAGASRSRITIAPIPDGGVVQLFEDSRDDGKTWTTQFKAVHRPAR